MFYCINRENVEFDEFDNYQKCAEKFLKSLCLFQDDLKDSFSYAILHSILFHLTEDNKVCKDKTEEILGKKKFIKFKEKKEMLQLDHSLENFFKKCHIANDFLEMKGLFPRDYERWDKFWYIIKKGVQGENNMICDCSFCYSKN